MLQLHGQTEITQFYDPTLRKEEIVRFDVLTLNPFFNSILGE